MNTKTASYVLFAFLCMIIAHASAAEPERGLLPPVQSNVAAQDKEKGQPKPPDKEKAPPPKKLTEPAQTDVFAQAPTMSSEFPTGFNPNMLGDFHGYFARQTFAVLGTQTVNTNKVFVGSAPLITTNAVATVPTVQNRTALVPFSAYGDFKIADNESPRPTDRVFVLYNYFGSLRGPATGAGTPIVTTTTTRTFVQGRQGPVATTVTNTTVIPGLPTPTANLHQEVFGFEKTFLDGRASVELRVPFSQQHGNLDGVGSDNVGDLTIIGRYALLLDRDTGNVFTTGLGITVPSGPSVQTIDGNLHSTLIQPWIGYIWNADRFFLHAFHSVVVPTDNRDVTLMFNDVGLNYWLYRSNNNRLLSFVVPMIEAHVTTPLNHRDSVSAIYVPDMVVMTGGVHFGIGRNTTLSLGVATPVTGPQPYNIEAFMQLNWRF